MKFENTDVYGFEHALRGMRNPLQSHHLADSIYKPWGDSIGKADMTLALKLVQAGAEHGKFMRQIQVWVDITAPRFWWAEFDTYHFHSANSESTMHTIHKRDLTENDFDGFMSEMELDEINCKIKLLRKNPSNVDCLLYVKRSLGEGFLQKRTVNTNYAELRNIYFQRRNHRLPHWHEFCDWIKTLPNSELITLDKQ
jgi:hypothetical protein